MNITRRLWERGCLVPSLIAMFFLLSPAMLLGADTTLPQAERAAVTITQKIIGDLLEEEGGGERMLKEQDRRMKIIASGNPYYVVEETVVYLGKEKIAMHNLPVPCEASILYQPLHRNDGNVLTIKVTKVLPGATTAWSTPQPE